MQAQAPRAALQGVLQLVRRVRLVGIDTRNGDQAPVVRGGLDDGGVIDDIGKTEAAGAVDSRFVQCRTQFCRRERKLLDARLTQLAMCVYDHWPSSFQIVFDPPLGVPYANVCTTVPYRTLRRKHTARWHPVMLVPAIIGVPVPIRAASAARMMPGRDRAGQAVA